MRINTFFVVQAEARAEFAERSVQKLQKEVDRLEGAYARHLFRFDPFCHTVSKLNSTVIRYADSSFLSLYEYTVACEHSSLVEHYILFSFT